MSSQSQLPSHKTPRGWALPTVLAADLVLGNDDLARVAVVRAGERVLEDADGPEHVADDLDLVGEVRRVAEDHLGARLEAHLLDARHGGLDAHGLVALVQHLVDVGVEHVGAAIDGRQAGEALGQLAEAVERVDVGRLAVPGHRVAVEADPLDGLGGLAGDTDVLVVGLVEGHGVADEVARAGLEAELVIHLLHGDAVDVEPCRVSASCRLPPHTSYGRTPDGPGAH